MTEKVWTLSEAARILAQAPHRLIYLCEKGVVIPDFGDAAGRGSSRGFSARNILEFAVAMKLRDLTIPVTPIRAIVYVLRAFEKVLQRQIPGFSMVKSFREKQVPQLRIIISDGKRLYFQLEQSNQSTKLFGGINFQRLLTGKMSHSTVQEIPVLGKNSRGWGGYEGSRHARIDVNVTAIARELALET